MRVRSILLSLMALAILMPGASLIVEADDEELSATYGGSSDPTGYFTENLGQWVDGVSFVGNTPGGHLAMGSGSAYLALLRYSGEGTEDEAITGGHVMAYRFLDSNDVPPVGSHELRHRNSYFLGNEPERWVSGARNYREVTYTNLWDGIDLSYVLTEKGPKYEFELSPGSNPVDIRIGLDGIEHLDVKGSELSVRLSEDLTIRDSGLVAYYADDMTVIGSAFRKLDDTTYGFDLDEYDEGRTVMIDPYLRFTFIGGSGGDSCRSFKFDEKDNIYVTGTTTSLSNFPITPGAFDDTYNGGFSGDIYVAKINNSFMSLDYCTYIGGTGTDTPSGLDVRNGEAVFSGVTDSSDYPTSDNAYNDTNVGWRTIIVTKLNRSGGSLEFSTLVDGGANESGSGAKYDDSGNVLVTGSTTSTDFPTTQGAYDTTLNSTGGGVSGTDMVILKLNSKGTGLIFSTFYGGAGSDSGFLVGVDRNGSIYVAGNTESMDLAMTSGAYSSSMSGIYDQFVARFNHNASKLERATYFGGSGYDVTGSVTLHPSGDVVMTGYTHASITTTSGAFDTTPNGGTEAFAARMDGNLTTLKASTYIGGSLDEREISVDVGPEGNIFLYGSTQSVNFPNTTGADDTTFNGTNNLNMYMAKLDGSLSTLMYSTFLGGNGYDRGYSIKVLSPFKVMLSGTCSSTDFKTEGYGFDQIKDTGGDGFLLELSLLAPPSPPRSLDMTRGDEWVHLTWEEPLTDGGSPVTSFEVFRTGQLVPPPEDPFVILPPGTHDYNDTTIKVDDEWYYYVKAVNKEGPSLRSNWIRISDATPPWLGLDLTPGTAVSATEVTFATEVFDNAFVDSVHVEYWWEGVSSVNITMERENDGTYSHTIPLLDENYAVSYLFSLNDTSDNWFRGLTSEVLVSGNIIPEFGEDRTQVSIKAGERIRFSVEAWDNVELDEVTVEFWSDDIYRQNTSMENVEGDVFEYELKTKRYSLAPVEYIFHAVDVSGHWNATEQDAVEILDAELPMIAYDTTLQEATTGDPFTFSVSISDNQEVSNAWVEYRINDMEFNSTLTSSYGNIFTHEVEMPDEIGRMNYRFFAIDSNGNMAWVPSKQVLVRDNDDPVLGDDLTNDTAYCGETFVFAVMASDNVAMGDVILEYWFGEGAHLKASMIGDGTYAYEMVMPLSQSGDISYFIKISDTSGNLVTTEPSKITVKDRVRPFVVYDLTPLKGHTGEEFEFAIKASDNVGIKRVSCIWGRGQGPQNELFLERGDGLFSGSVELPIDDLGALVYHFIVVDSSGNQITTEDRSVEVIDAMAPVIPQVQDLDVGSRTELSIEIVAEDNIGVASLVVENCPLPMQGNWIRGIIEEPGTYFISAVATDDAGNTARMEFTIRVTGDQGDGSSDDGGDPLWIYLLPLLAVSVLIFMLVFFLLARKGRKEKDSSLSMDSPLATAQEKPEEMDELERLFQASYRDQNQP
ncbi:MAG: SBBP repeat-containing protein [Thermoplasmatota archaeon]